MIAVASVPPTAFFCPAPLPSRNVMVWGDDAPMETMRAQFEAKGWQWATMLLGEQTKALVLRPPDDVEDRALCALVNDVNAGKFGKLNGGFANFGVPIEPKERGE